MDAFWIILSGSLIAISCGLLGCFLVLRKMSMIGDAISHAVLPGIVLAYLISGSRDSIPMLIGAAAIGLLTTIIIEFIHHKAKLQMDASIGITFTFLFAIGIILISLFTGQIDIDQDCVLYGEIAYVPLDLWISENGVNLGPRSVWIASILLLFILVFIWLGYKGLVITSFNSEFAHSLGIAIVFWQYALMGTVSITTIISFESVGAILVVAFLVVPPATAYLLTSELKKMLTYTILFGIFSSIGGYYLAYLINGSIAGAMATVAGLQFVLAWIWSISKSDNKVQMNN